MKRTDAQKMAFVKECLEIEKANGDVLGYIEVNWPSYTPRATWYNLQRQYLKRNTATMTEGKPMIPKGDEKELARKNREKILDCVLEVISKGGHPYDYLESIGYLNPMQAWADLKLWAKKNAPEKAMQLPANLRGLTLNRQKIPRMKEDESHGKDLKPGEPLPVKLPEKTGDHVSAEDYRKISGEIREPEKKPPTCCAPSTRKGTEVPDELPVCAVKSRVHGVWELSAIEGCVSLNWENRITHQECFLGLTAVEWQLLAEEIPVMLKQLGLK